MVVTLGTHDIASEKDPGDVLRDLVGVSSASGRFQKFCGWLVGRVVLLDEQQFGHQLVPRHVLSKTRLQPLRPVFGLDALFGPSFEHHHLEPLPHPPREVGGGEQPIDQFWPFVAGAIGVEGGCFLKRWHASGQVECHPPEKLGVVGQLGHRPGRLGLDHPIDVHVQRIRTIGRRHENAGQGENGERGQGDAHGRP